ncbi:hypothetical protein Ancab_038268 [Ancistrocladus abbreviatus]
MQSLLGQSFFSSFQLLFSLFRLLISLVAEKVGGRGKGLGMGRDSGGVFGWGSCNGVCVRGGGGAKEVEEGVAEVTEGGRRPWATAAAAAAFLWAAGAGRGRRVGGGWKAVAVFRPAGELTKQVGTELN